MLEGGLEVSERVRGIHVEIDNYPVMVSIRAEGEGVKGGRFDHRPIHQTPEDPLKILKTSKGFQGSLNDQHFLSFRIRITTQTHNYHNLFHLSGSSYLEMPLKRF